MKPVAFHQLTSLFSEEIQIPQKLIIYKSHDLGAIRKLPITNTRIFILVMSGELRLTFNHKEYTFGQGRFIDITDDKTVRFQEVSAGALVYCIFTNFDFLRETLKNIRPVPRSYMHRIVVTPALSISEPDASLLEQRLTELLEHLRRKEHTFYLEITRNLFLNLMYELVNIFNAKNAPRKPDFVVKKQDIITYRFIELVRKFCKEQHEIGFYASQLNITAKHLGRVVKNNTGKTLYEIISNELIAEAIDLITKEEVQIQQIADTLHFADIASFSKFFKRHTGLSPMQYREQ